MFKKSFVLFAFLFVFGFAGCKNNDSPVTPNEPQYLMPLAVGNIWIMQIKSYDSTGAIQEQAFDTTQVIGTKIINNETWYKMSENEAIINRADGVHEYMTDSTLGTVTGLIFKYPAMVGDTGTSLFGLTFKLVAKGVSETVPAGTFTCYMYQSENSYSYFGFTYYMKMHIWICPGKGIVKSEIYSRENNGILYKSNLSELISYHLN